MGKVRLSAPHSRIGIYGWRMSLPDLIPLGSMYPLQAWLFTTWMGCAGRMYA
jgi:hypothetical protein